MAYPGIGLKSYVQFGLEAAAWGTASAVAYQRIPVLRIKAEPGASMIKSENLDGKMTRGSMYKGPQLPRVTIDFELNANSEAMLRLVDCAMGTQAFGVTGAATTGPVTSIYTHVFRNEEFMNSISLELFEGNIPAGNCQRLLGAKVEEWSFTCTWAQDNSCIVICTMTFVGKQFQTDVTPVGSATSETPLPYLFSHLTVKDVGATASPTLRSLTFKQKNNLSVRPNLGSLYQDEPVRAGFVEPALDFECDFTSKTALDEFLNATQGSPQIKFVNGAVSLQVDIPKGYITAHDHAVDGPGVLTQKFTWEAIDDAASPNSGATITIADSIVSF